MAARRMSGSTWKGQVTRLHDLEPPERALLDLAADALDRANAAQVCIDADGVLVDGMAGHGKKQNPAIQVRRDASAEFLRLCRVLGIVGVEAEAD